jgi:amidase
VLDPRIIVEALDLGGSGPTVAVKDCIDIKGFPTRGGSDALSDAPLASAHARVVEHLLNAGCRIVGKANMHELAYGVTGINPHTGTPPNPFYPALVPGGSSSGSAAAVAAGLVDFAIGTDTGGSIRTPAACCGVFGFKPSFGRVDRTGAHPAQSSLDCIGPFARDITMLERAMEIIAPGFQRVDAVDAPRLARVGVGAEEAIEATLDAALAGLNVASTTLPSIAAAFDASIAIIGAETWAAFGHLTSTGRVGADVAARLMAASRISAEKIDAAETERVRFRAEVDVALQGFDALVLPTMPCFPPRLDALIDPPATLRMTALVRPFNLSGHPALTIPLIAPSGLPVGMQIVGRIGGDAHLIAVARALLRLQPIASSLQTGEFCQ